MADSRRDAEADAAAAAAEEQEARRAISFAAPPPLAAAAVDAGAAGGAALLAPAAPTSTTVAASLAELEAERAIHRRRAERFGGEFVDPAKKPGPLRDADRRARLERKDGFVTGIDLFADEERARIAARAARFGNIAPSSAASASAGDNALGAADPSASAAAAAPPPLSGTAVPLRNISYAPDEDELKKRARAARFQTAYDGGEGLMDVDLLEERRPLPPPGAVARRPEAIHVYGVDVLSTSEILRYFTEWGPTYVEWLDDSSANVVFADELTAKRALVGRGKPLPPDDGEGGGAAAAAVEGGGGGDPPSSARAPPLDPTDIRNAPFLWHRGDDAIKAGTAVPIVYRMATVLDVKPPKGEKKASRGLWRLRPSDALSTVRKGGGASGGGGGGKGGASGNGGGRRRSSGGGGGGRNRGGRGNNHNNSGGGDVSMADVLESAGKVTTGGTGTGGGAGAAVGGGGGAE